MLPPQGFESTTIQIWPAGISCQLPLRLFHVMTKGLVAGSTSRHLLVSLAQLSPLYIVRSVFWILVRGSASNFRGLESFVFE